MTEYTEKDRRVYYQDIVYDVCHVLDEIEGVTNPVRGIVCGTVGKPTVSVQKAMRRIHAAMVAARAVLKAVNEKTDGTCLTDARNSWNKDAHIEITLTVGEIWALQDALGKGQN